MKKFVFFLLASFVKAIIGISELNLLLNLFYIFTLN